MLNNLKFYKIIYLALLSVIFTLNLYAQHRGDDITFQGLTNQNDASVRYTAMGSAATSLIGDVSSMFYNPAGLVGVEKLQVSVSANTYNSSWRENQHYRPNRFFVTLPFYLEGLYTPLPEDNGMFDHERVWTEDQQIDSSYIVKLPDLGLDPFSEEAADWKEESSKFTFNNIAVAFPFTIADNKFVVSAGYFRQYNIEDFDRNDTYLNPHIGYLGYGEMGRVNGVDTLIVDWFRYKRQRSGPIDNITGALAYDFNQYVKVGFGLKTSWGETDDLLSINQVGTFDLVRENRFRYSYVDSSKVYEGVSNFSSTAFNIGFLFDFEKFKFGLNIDLPYTIEREWDYTVTISDSNGISSNKQTGIDKLKIPAVFNFGVSFKPVQNFTAAIDYEYAPFSKTEFEFSRNETVQNNYVDRHILKIGLEYMPTDYLSLLAGYRNIPSTFVPDGASETESGPDANSITGGLSIHTFLGRFDLSYEYRTLKYYDSYFSNTNYVTESYSNFMLGFLFSL